MPARRISAELVGRKLGPFSVLAALGVRKQAEHSLSWFRCQCECGRIVELPIDRLRRSKHCSKQCAGSTHGGSQTTAYKVWANMRQRCENPKNSHFRRYGGRGISCCQDWKLFENFLRDMGQPPDGMTIERVDNDKGYFKENCRWASRKEQSRNTSRNRRIMVGGKYMILTDAAVILGVNRLTLSDRVHRQCYQPG